MGLGESNHHFGGTVTSVLLRHVEAKAGADAVAEVLRRSGVNRSLEELHDDASWVSYDEFRALLEAGSAVLGGARCYDDLHRTVEITAGSMPDATEMLQALGSPAALFDALEGNNGVSAVTDSHGLNHQLGPNEYAIGIRFKEGFEPFPEHCSFFTGLYAMTPKLFGLGVEELEESKCVFRGDDHCEVRLRWEDPSERSEMELLRMRLSLAERRLEAFRETVSDLVSDDELETILHRIVLSAARAMRAPSFVLALEPLPWRSPRIFGHGLTDEQAGEVAGELLAGADLPDRYHVVEVQSTKRMYGKLAAMHAHGGGNDVELPILRAYGRLAASALDSAMALEEARRQTASARALLELSRALADVTSTEQMATNVARATPMVVDCDFAGVMLHDPDDVWRVKGHHGFDPVTAQSVATLEFPHDADSLVTSFSIVTPETVEPAWRPVLEALGAVALATLPVLIDGAIAGSLVVGVAHDPSRLIDNPEVEEQLRGLGGQVSTALRNARLVDQIRHQALHDALTGLPNRALVLDRGEHLLARARRANATVAALFIDLDGFKDVNDSFGHAAGDELLRAVAARLTAAVRGSDTIARLGGDEFVVLTDGSTLDASPELVAQRILDVLHEPFDIGRDTPLRIGASIGIAVTGGGTAGELLRDADVALYEAKAKGKGCFVNFAPEMQAAVADRIGLEMDLRRATERGEFFLVYQPIFNLRDDTITGVEALLRWQHPERGVLQPDLFIPLLEASGLIEQVGRWVLEEATRQTAEWRAAGNVLDISVNVSPRQLEHDRLVDDVQRALDASGLPAAALIVEITETTIMRDAPGTVRRLARLKELGVRVAIDDFGTGYSSLAYLQQFPVDALKIDRSFISAIAESPASGALIHTLVQLGKTLGLETLAEGIEDRDQVERLQFESCDSGQGFLFAMPLAPADLERFLAERDQDGYVSPIGSRPALLGS